MTTQGFKLLHNSTRGARLSHGIRIVAFLTLHICLLAVVACDDYDSFTTDRSTTLSFSTDTVRFDTLLATVPSATKTLIVYNRADKGLRISSVRLERGAESPFRINVDGQDLSRTPSNMAADFEVRRGDSIIVRIEVTLPANADDSIHEVTDRLAFTLESGTEQHTALVASSQNANFHHAWVISSDTTLTATRPIVVYDSLVVARGATLTLAAGTQLLFHEGAGIDVHGTLVAEGTLEEPVVMRGDRTDHMFDYLPYDRLPSRWEGLRFTPESAGNRLCYLDLHSGTYGIVCDSSLTDTLKLTLTNCRIHNIGGDGLSVKAARIEAVNTEISNTLGHCVSLLGGTTTFTHCTLAQFYPLDANRGDALRLTNRGGDDAYYPLHKAEFVNCVITGYADDVLMGSWFENQDYEANYIFRNCFIATEVTDDPVRFISITYDDPKSETASFRNFRLIDTHNFIYDFTPDSLSAIRGVADASAALPYPTDRLGRNRLSDNAPDAGCYEYTPDN